MRCVSLQGSPRTCPVCEQVHALDDKCYSLNVLDSLNFEDIQALTPALFMLQFWEGNDDLRLGLKRGRDEMILCEKCTKEIVLLVHELKELLNAH